MVNSHLRFTVHSCIVTKFQMRVVPDKAECLRLRFLSEFLPIFQPMLQECSWKAVYDELEKMPCVLNAFQSALRLQSMASVSGVSLGLIFPRPKVDFEDEIMSVSHLESKDLSNRRCSIRDCIGFGVTRRATPHGWIDLTGFVKHRPSLGFDVVQKATVVLEEG